jgi:hypothetical protein
MKNLVLALFVTLSSVVFSQPDLDSLGKLPFYNNPTTVHDLSSFDLTKVYDLDNFSELLEIRYGCVVSCEHFFERDDPTGNFIDVFIYLRPTDSEMCECGVFTSLAVVEKLFKQGILLEYVNLYYEICRTTSEN